MIVRYYNFIDVFVLQWVSINSLLVNQTREEEVSKTSQFNKVQI